MCLQTHLPDDKTLPLPFGTSLTVLTPFVPSSSATRYTWRSAVVSAGSHSGSMWYTAHSLNPPADCRGLGKLQKAAQAECGGGIERSVEGGPGPVWGRVGSARAEGARGGCSGQGA